MSQSDQEKPGVTRPSRAWTIRIQQAQRQTYRAETRTRQGESELLGLNFGEGARCARASPLTLAIQVSSCWGSPPGSVQQCPLQRRLSARRRVWEKLLGMGIRYVATDGHPLKMGAVMGLRITMQDNPEP